MFACCWHRCHSNLDALLRFEQTPQNKGRKLSAPIASGGANVVATPTATEFVVHGSVSLRDGIVPLRLVRVEEQCGRRFEATELRVV
jgi:hypothetical protein